jgi:cytochrome c-type biogenesis protein CcmH/NrfG
MMDRNQTPTKRWTLHQAVVLSVVCLAAGIAGGWSIRGPQSSSMAGSEKAADVTVPQGRTAGPVAQIPGRGELKMAADSQAVPLIEKLNADPENSELLTSLGNLYYDAQEYPVAVDYYKRALKSKPSDVAVRTDLGTADWYMGNADLAIAEFNRALAYAPNNANTLFNLGLVKWRGKRDGAGAVDDWKKLLKTNPNYEGKDKVEQMLTEVEQQAGIQPAVAANQAFSPDI